MPHTIAVRNDTPNFIMLLTLVRTLRHLALALAKEVGPKAVHGFLTT
jgi:hypothetical protein